MTPGDKISHYEILKLLGKGGMGEVYLAHDTVLDRDVAIKFLPESIQHDPAIRERFLREAKAAAALDHPFICKIYETSVFEGRSYIVMEYVEGHNLQERMKEKKIAARDALQVALEIAEALEIAHAKGIVHRDLKPANIMCTPQGHAKVMDFGIAKRVLPVPESVSATLTQTAVTVQGTIMGTIDYLSPEQAKGAPVDGRSDIFSLGIVLYEMLSGKHPFSKSTPIETLSAVIRDPVPAVSIKPKSVNPAVHHILKKCLAKNPADRYPKIADFSAELRKVREEIGAGVPFFLRGWRAAVSAVILIAAGLAIWRFVLPPKVSAPQPEQKPVSVLVADFKNQTADPVFDGSLEYALGVGLEAAPFITTYRRPNARQIASQLNPEAKGRLDAEMAQLVCVREGINMFMDGAIEPKGGGYVLKVWARDPLNAGKATEYSRDIPSKKEVLTAAAWLSNKIIADLGGTPAKSAQELAGETFTTSSLEAINAYTKAQELSIIGKQEEAMEEYFKIIKLDPNFGRAYSGLAILYRNRGQLAECEKYFNLALAKIDQMGEREKFRTMAMYYLMQRNSQKAI
jgi:tRNA A-37 threonylcarbamoyl transferase component Bud32